MLYCQGRFLPIAVLPTPPVVRLKRALEKTPAVLPLPRSLVPEPVAPVGPVAPVEIRGRLLFLSHHWGQSGPSIPFLPSVPFVPGAQWLQLRRSHQFLQWVPLDRSARLDLATQRQYQLAVSINEHWVTATLIDSVNAGDKGGRLRTCT